MIQSVLQFLERFGNVVGRTLMVLIYAVVVAPVAVVYRLFCDPLMTRRAPGSTYVEWSQVNDSLEDARRQD